MYGTLLSAAPFRSNVNESAYSGKDELILNFSLEIISEKTFQKRPERCKIHMTYRANGIQYGLQISFISSGRPKDGQTDSFKNRAKLKKCRHITNLNWIIRHWKIIRS